MKPPSELYLLWLRTPREGASKMKMSATSLICAALCFSAANAEPKTELGEINGAKFRIDVPEKWNGGLVVYCHGYSPVPGIYKEGKLPPVVAVFTDQGYALAPSGYPARGWGLQDGGNDLARPRRYFAYTYG